MPSTAPFSSRASLYGETGKTWLSAAIFILLAVLLPVAVLAMLALGGSLQHWLHLVEFVLPQAFVDTVLLLVGVGIGTVFIGTGTAWLVTAYNFPGRRVLVWALLLPLAVPTYIVAFVYLDILHPLGPVQSVIRDMLGYDSPRQFRLPDLRALPGAIFVLTLVLYPYVYLTARAMFATQAANVIEAARTLGCNGRETFYRVALPMARPAIAVGACLVMFEVLNDIGASEFLGVRTLTVSVYTTWITRSDLAGAAQIAVLMLILVVGLVWLEWRGRRRQRYITMHRMRPMQAQSVGGLKGLGLTALCAVPVCLGFIAPAWYLLSETIKHFQTVGGVSAQLLASAGNTVLVAAVATPITIVCGLVIVWTARRVRETTVGNWRSGLRLAGIGYAVPGTVLAIGLLTPLSFLDTGLGIGLNALFGIDSGLLIMGSMTALVVAYTIRFLAIAIGGIDAGLARVPASLEQASRLLGENSTATLWRVHLPLLRPAIVAATLLVFVDAMKELPATLLLRPINFETLSTWLYAEAIRGTYEEGAVAALIIVVIGLLPVILLSRMGWSSER